MKFKRNEKGELVLDAAGNPIPLTEDGQRAVGEGQLEAINKAVAEAVRSETGKVITPEAIGKAIAEHMRQYGAVPGITPASIVGVSTAPRKSEASKWARLAQITQNAIDLAIGNKPRHEGPDLSKMRAAREEFFARTGQSTTTTAGGYMIPTEEVLAPIDLISAEESLISKCNRVPMQTGSITIVTADGDITVYWVPETTNTSDMGDQAKGLKPEGQFTFGRVTLTRHMVVARVKISRQVANYTAGYMESFLQKALPNRLRRACEIAILRGTGTAASDPVTGLDTLITTGVIPFDPTDPFKSILSTIASPELELPGVAETDLIVSNMRGLMALLSVKDNNLRPILTGPLDGMKIPSLYGYPFLKSPNVLATYPAAGGTDSRLYTGDFGRHAHVGLDDSIFSVVDPYSDLKNNLIVLQYEMAFGFTVTSEKAFAYTDIPR